MSLTQNENTIRNILNSAITILKKSEIEFPEINADTLLAYVLSCDKTNLYTKPDNIVDNTDVAKYNELIHKRASHVPLQYITRRVEFMSLDFVVDERVLIPRPETEILVETVLKKTDNKLYHDRAITVIDIGTGSGNIAVSLAKNRSNIKIYASDISQEALTVASENIQRHDVADKIQLLHGNVFDAFSSNVKKGQVDFIVSNPPYVSESESRNLEPELIDHEPLLALVGGEDGLFFYKQIIKDARSWIKPGGYLVIEIGETQADSIIKLMQNELHYDEIETIKDLQGNERIISARINNAKKN
ncbi:MAG: peptide chain release factor N(5)-glutamine methyltransferase [Candidatus Scalindua sp.]|nr:peptide chain release factor N(5)-glutamine methyltransferase [Candidatus Scalindua sp.]MDV5166702.1 peptide chain release factor N(5)-glutamine methyltransferase [Candidatus Scalindua sp.]